MNTTDTAYLMLRDFLAQRELPADNIRFRKIRVAANKPISLGGKPAVLFAAYWVTTPDNIALSVGDTQLMITPTDADVMDTGSGFNKSAALLERVEGTILSNYPVILYVLTT